MADSQTAVFGGGCFWCLEAVFLRARGVTRVESGYMGGTVERPTYQSVCGGNTGHAEVVRVTFDPALLSFHDLLEIFFEIHDPTTVNRQGNDVGTQYRSAIFYLNAEQQHEAQEFIAHLTAEKAYAKPIVTQVLPATEFFKAEGYHQNYYDSNPYAPYCQFVVAPKVRKFLEHFEDKVKAEAL